MEVVVREYGEQDVGAMVRIWNEIVENGQAFPQMETLDQQTAPAFFSGQSHCGVAEAAEIGDILGLYILHPNNVGRCGHIANASYGVASLARGQHIGEKLVSDCINKAKLLGFRILQFNAVVRTNIPARRLYEKFGFQQLGVIPGGFLMKDGHYEDICPYYRLL